MLCLGSIVSIPISGGNSGSTFSFSDFGDHRGRPLPSILLSVFSRLASKTLSFDLVFTIVLPLDTDGFVFSTKSSLCGNFISTEVRRRHGAESLVGGVEDRRLSSLPPPD